MYDIVKLLWMLNNKCDHTDFNGSRLFCPEHRKWKPLDAENSVLERKVIGKPFTLRQRFSNSGAHPCKRHCGHLWSEPNWSTGGDYFYYLNYFWRSEVDKWKMYCHSCTDITLRTVCLLQRKSSPRPTDGAEAFKRQISCEYSGSHTYRHVSTYFICQTV